MRITMIQCQCPLGLLPHFYGAETKVKNFDKLFAVSMPSRAVTSFLQKEDVKICRQQFVSMPSRAVTSFLLDVSIQSVTPLQVCQCPLGLLPHFYLNAHFVLQ